MAASSQGIEVQCKRSRKCSKLNGHKGRCNNEKALVAFWESSPVINTHKRKREDHRLGEEYESTSSRLRACEEELGNTKSEYERSLNEKDLELASLHKAIEERNKHVETMKRELSVQTQQYKQVKCMVSSLGLDHKQFSKSKRVNNSTSKDMINDSSSSTRYRRRKETEKALTFIHGGEVGSFYGAWDNITANAEAQLISELMIGYKKGKHLQQLFGKSMKDYQLSSEAMKQALALKYQNFLSRRKFTLVCKTQSSYFNAEKEVWLPRNINCLGLDLRHPQPVSSKYVEKFVKDLHIGHVDQIPGAPGVSRTITGLIFMIADLHIRVPHLTNKLIWFNEMENHLIFQFSDDGAPETSQLTMSIGSLTLWNLGDRVRSRDYQYLLHCVSLGEKHQVLEDLWKQHTDEMAMLEGNRLTIGGKHCTVEFQPSADMSWQSWSNNELNQAATHPSPYANVSKSNISTMGGSIGFAENDTWKPYTNDIREAHVKKVNSYVSSLPAKLKEETKHSKKLAYMAENGIRQVGPPRIGIFAQRQRPEPLHCEINAWQQLLNIIYLEALRRGKFNDFILVLGAPVSVSPTIADVPPSSEIPSGSTEILVDASTPTAGCGLRYLVGNIKEHHSDVNKRYNKIPTRLIGRQAIALARYAYRLVDHLQTPDESQEQSIKRLALCRIVHYLRNACAVFNKLLSTPAELLELDENCKMYFNLMCLFYPTNVNVTTWTVAYAIPYHAFQLYDMYKVGYGTISLQAKEAKHAAVKNDLALTNRSTKVDNTGKWWQLLRANYIRSFYLPEHQPMPTVYKSHYQSRIPSHCDLEGFCNCGRTKDEDGVFCKICLDSRELVTCAQKQEISRELDLVLKPWSCEVCGECFADKDILQTHLVIHNCNTDPRIQLQESSRKNPKDMSVAELKSELRKLNLSLSGKKDILVKRLESRLTGSC